MDFELNDEIMIVEEPEKVYNIKHRAFLFSKNVVHFVTDTQYQRIHFSLFEQLIRSATSIGANLVEGKSGSSAKDFIKYYTIALKSANETKYWLCLIRDSIETDNKKIIELLQEAVEISNIIASIIISSKDK